MPQYSWLRPRDNDSEATLQMKRRTARKLRELRAAFEAHVEAAEVSDDRPLPSDTTQILRLATWNIREFDSNSYGLRTREAKAYIAEILSNFDLIAVQEVRRDLSALNRVKDLLGPSWDYVATDVTAGGPGNKERMAFLFNRQRVIFRDVVGELTLPHGQRVTDPFGDRFRVEGGVELTLPDGESIVSPTDVIKTLESGATKVKKDVELPLPEGAKVTLPPGATVRFAKNARVPATSDGAIEIDGSSNPTLPEAAEIVLPPNSLVGGPQQFARTPFVASFQAGWLKINLATVHIYYGSGSTGMARRKEEIRRLTELLADRAKSDSDSDADSYFFALGDFNIVTPEHETMEALKSNDFMIPKPLQNVPGSNVKKDKFYDQIAIWTGESSRRSSYTQIVPYRAGVFDFFETVYRSDEEPIYREQMKKADSDEYYASYAGWRTHQMSDHLPMWVELHIDFANEYLDQVEAALETKLAEDTDA